MVFGQHAHARLYAADIGDRLDMAGFRVERIRLPDKSAASLFERWWIEESGHFWLCQPR